MSVSVSVSGEFVLTRPDLLIGPCRVVFWQTEELCSATVDPTDVFYSPGHSSTRSQSICPHQNLGRIFWLGKRTSQPVVRTRDTEMLWVKPVVVNEWEQKFLTTIFSLNTFQNCPILLRIGSECVFTLWDLGQQGKCKYISLLFLARIFIATAGQKCPFILCFEVLHEIKDNFMLVPLFYVKDAWLLSSIVFFYSLHFPQSADSWG